MNIHIRSSIIVVFILSYSSITIQAQNPFPQDYFRSPLDIPVYLSGNFAEIRSNHFHSGIDIKTQGKEGLNVYAVADGYVSRIKIEAGGYGRALYITHPNGYVSVYAHLKVFAEEIEKYSKNMQYKKRKHAINMFPPKDKLPVKKGEVIALSGNSGRSSGPHLHFEIREEATEYPLNVLLFNFDIKDNIKPVITSVSLYPIQNNSFINSSNSKKIYEVIESNGIYKVKVNTIIEAGGKIGFGLETVDYLNGVNNKCGIYEMQLYIDGKKINSHKMDKFSFYESRYINSFIDYEEKRKNNRKIQKAFIDPNNKLSIYTSQGNGIYDFNDTDTHLIKFVVKDAYDNTSFLQFNVLSKIDPPPFIVPKDTNFVQTLTYNAQNTFEKHDIKLHFPKDAFYTDIDLTYAKTMPIEGCYSWIHHIHNTYTPVHKSFTIQIKPDSLPVNLRDKAIIAKVSENNDFIYVGGSWKNGYISANTRSFGKYTITHDTIAPTIIPVNITNHANMNSQKAIQFKITDNLSGIKSYNGYIDNKWVLFEYDAKSNLLTYEFDPSRLSKGKAHNLILHICDRKQNIATYSCVFKW